MYGLGVSETRATASPDAAVDDEHRSGTPCRRQRLVSAVPGALPLLASQPTLPEVLPQALELLLLSLLLELHRSKTPFARPPPPQPPPPRPPSWDDAAACPSLLPWVDDDDAAPSLRCYRRLLLDDAGAELFPLFGVAPLLPPPSKMAVFASSSAV